MSGARVVSLGARLGSGGAVVADVQAASLRSPAVPARIDLLSDPPDRALIHRFGAGQCLQLGLCPWRRVGAVTVVLAARPGALYRHEGELTRVFGPVRIALVAEPALQAAILAAASPGLVAEAEARVPLHLSSRRWDGRRLGRVGLALIATALFALMLAPVLTLATLCLWAVFVLFINMALKLAAAFAALRRPAPPPEGTAPVPMRLPVVSIIVALYHETEIIDALLRRLGRLDYPADLLDICLVLEDDDLQTRAMLDTAPLPANVQVIAVPQGTIRTKPRALNFALNFARGQIIGIYDAEDAPAPDQIRKVVQRFAERGPQVACLQGALDYYNHSSNWLARCFTLEYATWFRLYLPGIARLGLVVPLGGTTLFLRRHALRAVGGWDAHNVTEDADLGVRLAREGFRTELIDTVTQEEANARAWPWVKQRSRWLKGYMVTWAVHMRDPGALWHDLGPWRFCGFQVQFLGALSQFLFAPFLWSFWLMALGLPHPLNAVLPPQALLGLAALFLLTEVMNLAITAIAARRAGKARLALWAPTLQLYFPLATLAAWKGLIETVTRPHYWHKTTHGVWRQVEVSAPPPLSHPVAAE